MNRKHFRCISIGLLHVLLLVLLMLYVCVVYIFSFYLSRWIKFITVAWTEHNLRSFSRDSACAVEEASTAATTAHRRQRAATGTSEILSVQRTYTTTTLFTLAAVVHKTDVFISKDCALLQLTRGAGEYRERGGCGCVVVKMRCEICVTLSHLCRLWSRLSDRICYNTSAIHWLAGKTHLLHSEWDVEFHSLAAWLKCIYYYYLLLLLLLLVKIPRAGRLKVRFDVTYKWLMQQNCVETLQSNRESLKQECSLLFVVRRD